MRDNERKLEIIEGGRESFYGAKYSGKPYKKS